MILQVQKNFDNMKMNISHHIIIHDILIPSLKKLYEVDFWNIEIGVSERNICARLAYHMENIMREYDETHSDSLFNDYYVDVEYNRMGNGCLKRYETPNGQSQYMVSDLLIHSRGCMCNYLAVEMKRKGNRKGVIRDKERLRGLVLPNLQDSSNQCVHNTLVGAFIEFSPTVVKIDVFENKGETYRIPLKYEQSEGLRFSLEI